MLKYDSQPLLLATFYRGSLGKAELEQYTELWISRCAGLPGLGVCRAPLEWGGSVEAPRSEGAEALGTAVHSLEGCHQQTSSGC